MKISLLHPSRGRPDKARATANRWIELAGKEVEHLVCVDFDDPTLPKYQLLFPYHFASDAKSLVEATNNGAKHITGDIIIYLSDDFDCFDNWALEIEKYFKDGELVLLKVDDGLQKFHVPVLTIPIMSKALLNHLGYFFHPDFKSMHCDEHLYQRCMKLGVIKFSPQLKFQHNHVSNGKAPDDETYRRSAGNWNHGVMMMNKHRRLGFTE